MSREQWKALRRFAAWAVVGGIVGAGVNLWAHFSPVIGTAVQLGLLVTALLFSLQIMRDTRRMERERLEVERRALQELESLRQQMKLLEELRRAFGRWPPPPSSSSSWMAS